MKLLTFLIEETCLKCSQHLFLTALIYFEHSFLTHSVKSVRIQSYSGPHFPAFGLNTERYSVSLCTQSECGKMRTRITPNTETFCAVTVLVFE